MKRKRGPRAGHKKGKTNASSKVNDPINTEDNTCLDQTDDSQQNFEMDVDPPSVGPSSNIPTIDEADLPNDRSAGKPGPARFKVKLKSSRVLEPHRSNSDAQTASDTDKSNPQFALELNDSAVEKEDSIYSEGQTSEMENNISQKLPRKAGSIKIKSSRALGASSEAMQDKIVSKLSSTQHMPGEKILVLSDNEKSADSSAPKNSRQREIKVTHKDPRYNEKELSSALAVIKKVMKMDAAVPFNAPVNPVALGIPDYFDIIDTPMDFGTICQDLEHGRKYMNSEDVFRDVQYIWENCYRYNNKGDYILDLMKRVKKNFMKYWTAAGLYFDTPSNGSTESTHIEGIKRPSQDKLYHKGKSKHKRRRYGIDRHKSDCLCAVCVVRRRRKEREENTALTESQISDANLSRGLKLEENSPLDNPCSEDGTSSLDHSQEMDANADAEEAEAEIKVETSEQIDSAQPGKQEAVDNEMELSPNARGSSEPSLQRPLENGTGEDSNQHSQEQETDTGIEIQPGDPEEGIVAHQQDQQEESRQGDPAERSHQIALQESLQEVNDSIFDICRTLFPSDGRSVWNGPHPLSRRRQEPVGDSPIHAAVSALMK